MRVGLLALILSAALALPTSKSGISPPSPPAADSEANGEEFEINDYVPKAKKKHPTLKSINPKLDAFLMDEPQSSPVTAEAPSVIPVVSIVDESSTQPQTQDVSSYPSSSSEVVELANTIPSGNPSMVEMPIVDAKEAGKQSEQAPSVDSENISSTPVTTNTEIHAPKVVEKNSHPASVDEIKVGGEHTEALVPVSADLAPSSTPISTSDVPKAGVQFEQTIQPEVQKVPAPIASQNVEGKASETVEVSSHEAVVDDTKVVEASLTNGASEFEPHETEESASLPKPHSKAHAKAHHNRKRKQPIIIVPPSASSNIVVDTEHGITTIRIDEQLDEEEEEED